MGSSSRSSKATSRLVSTWRQHITTMRSWCGRHRYVALGVVLSSLFFGVLALSFPNGSSVTETSGFDEEEFADLGLEDEVVDDVGRGQLEGSAADCEIGYARVFSGVHGSDVELWRRTDPSDGGRCCHIRGTARSSVNSPVWLAGTIETDDSPVAPFPQTSTGPILLPQ